MEKIALEEAWGVLWGNDYKYQFQDDWTVIPEGKVLVGRAVTGVMVPRRPDLHDCLLEYGHEEEGRVGFFNSWVIETLLQNDVLVIDMFDKIFQGTYSGGNLSNTADTRIHWISWGTERTKPPNPRGIERKHDRCGKTRALLASIGPYFTENFARSLQRGVCSSIFTCSG